MVTPEEAELLSKKFMEGYINACKCDTTQDVGNVLMKLVSMCGLGMCAVVGQPEAVARLNGTALYIAKAQEGKQWKCERVYPNKTH